MVKHYELKIVGSFSLSCQTEMDIVNYLIHLQHLKQVCINVKGHTFYDIQFISHLLSIGYEQTLNCLRITNTVCY